MSVLVSQGGQVSGWLHAIEPSGDLTPAHATDARRQRPWDGRHGDGLGGKSRKGLHGALDLAVELLQGAVIGAGRPVHAGHGYADDGRCGVPGLQDDFHRIGIHEEVSMFFLLLFNALFWGIPALIVLINIWSPVATELAILLLGLAVLARMGKRV